MSFWVLAVVDSNRSDSLSHIAKPLFNVFTQSPSGAISMHIHLDSFYVYTNHTCSHKSVRMCRLV